MAFMNRALSILRGFHDWSVQQRYFSRLFDFPVFEFDRGISSEDVHGDLELAFIGVNFLDHTAEVEERTVVDFDGLADFEADLGSFGVFGFSDLGFDDIDLLGADGHGAFASHEADDALGIADEVPGFLQDPLIFIEQDEVDVDIAGVKFSGGNGFLAVADLGDLLHGHQDFADVLGHLLGLETSFDAVFDLLLLAGQEQKVKDSIERRLKTEEMAEYIREVLVPMEKVAEVRNGKKTVTTRKLHPGYVYIDLVLLDENQRILEKPWYFIRDTQGIIGFVGGERPVPVSPEEIDVIKA